MEAGFIQETRRLQEKAFYPWKRETPVILRHFPCAPTTALMWTPPFIFIRREKPSIRWSCPPMWDGPVWSLIQERSWQSMPSYAGDSSFEKEGGGKKDFDQGKAVVTAQAAAVFAEEGISLLGNESQTVGPEENPEEVHLRLLGAGITLLEGICLGQVPEGVYFLCAAPLKLGGADGAPCRAVLLKGLEEEKET